MPLRGRVGPARGAVLTGHRRTGRRRRLLACIFSYGGALGVFAIIVSLVARTKLQPPGYEPQHLEPTIAFFMSGSGLVAGGLVAWTLTAWLVQRAEHPQHPLAWPAVGLGYAIMVPFLTGALAPVSLVFLNTTVGITDTPAVVTSLADSVFRAPRIAFEYGALSLGPTAMAAVMFVIGAWVIDRANSHPSITVSRYGAFGVTAALSVAVVGFVSLAPAATIYRLG